MSKNSDPSIGIVIPARLGGVRLPGKVLLDFHGLPMIEHVRRRGLLNSFGVPVIVASGDEDILKVVQNFGGTTIKSERDHTSGMSRTGEAAEKLGFDYYLVLQGDEILSLPRHIDQMISRIRSHGVTTAINATTPLDDEGELTDTSIVKCLLDCDQKILSMFRNSPLVSTNSIQMDLLKKVSGLFAFSKQGLKSIIESKPQPIERNESIEQMRILELGYHLDSILLDKNLASINLPRDVKLVEESLISDSEQIGILKEILQ